jgi:hypothetical protein
VLGDNGGQCVTVTPDLAWMVPLTQEALTAWVVACWHNRAKAGELYCVEPSRIEPEEASWADIEEPSRAGIDGSSSDPIDWMFIESFPIQSGPHATAAVVGAEGSGAGPVLGQRRATTPAVGVASGDANRCSGPQAAVMTRPGSHDQSIAVAFVCIIVTPHVSNPHD